MTSPVISLLAAIRLSSTSCRPWSASSTYLTPSSENASPWRPVTTTTSVTPPPRSTSTCLCSMGVPLMSSIPFGPPPPILVDDPAASITALTGLTRTSA